MSILRALLLTDVVDSTRLSLRVGDAEMARLWATHDRAARDLLPAFRGREIDKTDGMLLLFDGAADAVGYALAYQRTVSLLVPEFRARAGLHVGLVTLRENSPSDIALGAKPVEIEGVAKATAARVMSVASGGQVLLSDDARQSLPEGTFRLQSHGHWRLKGLDQPIELFEVGTDSTHFQPPVDADKAYRIVWRDGVWCPVREIRHSLPAQRDSFVGRAEALDGLSRRIAAGARLVSVLGLGGTGKTRLVTHYAHNWLGEYPGGVWFCDLAPARSLDGIVSAVALGLDVPLGREDPVVQLGHAIAGRGRCLVILDNFEQVARHAQATLSRWLDRAEQACFLVTSREVLGLPGEDVLALPPLLPHDASALFVQRAAAAVPEFHPSVEDQSVISSLVALLDGIPLAIELAAARVRVMSPRVLLQRMSERFKLLTSQGGRFDRQATLRATFDWSWDLLSSSEKAALAQLSVFEGGFTLEAAEAVLDLAGFEDVRWTVDVVHSLVNKSFVRPRGGERLDLLVSVQLYAAEHLQTEGRYAGSGPQAMAAAELRAISWFAALGPDRTTENRCADLDNLVASCRRASSLGDGDLAAGALSGALRALSLRGPFGAGIELAEMVCAMPQLSDHASALAHLALGRALRLCGRGDRAREALDTALTHALKATDRSCEASIALHIGELHVDAGLMDEARTQLLAAIQLVQGLGDRRLESSAINGLGILEHTVGHPEKALLEYERALALARESSDRRLEGNLVANIANLHAELGRMDDAHEQSMEALAIARDSGNRKLEGNTLCNLSVIYYVQERFSESEAASKAALVVARELGNLKLECVALCNLGIAFGHLGRPGEAQGSLEEAVRLAHAMGEPLKEGEFLGFLGLLHARQGRHGEAKRCLDSGEALLRGACDQFGLGVLLTSRAEACHLAGDSRTAAAALAAAAAIATEVGAGPTSEIGRALARVGKLIASAGS